MIIPADPENVDAVRGVGMTPFRWTAGFGIMNWHKAYTPEELEAFYVSVLPAIRRAARDVGFGIGLHGSMRRDLDLIAVPWVENHATPDELAATIQKAACGLSNAKFAWEAKPCGRIATAFPICWSAHNVISSGHIDLSVMMIPNSEIQGPRSGPPGMEGSTT